MKKCEGEAAKSMPVKPVTLIMDELKGMVVNAINGSGLAPVLVEAAIKDVFSEVSRQAMLQRASEAEAYLAAVKEFEEKDNEYNEEQEQEQKQK